MTTLRPYQRGAVDAVFDYWAGNGGNPLVDMATGTGKSVVISTLSQEIIGQFPDMRILNLVHVQELVEQNFLALIRGWKDAPAGIYSAGLGRRDVHHRITFASVQSVYKRGSVLAPRHLVLIDEAHLVPNGGTGMYRTLLEQLSDIVPDLRVCGFSATPFRLDSGRLDAGDGRLFHKTVYSYGIGQGIEDGWLSPLVSKRGGVEIDVSGVAKRGGEFVAGALEAVADVDRITATACREIVDFGQTQGRRSWLIFCTGVKHAHHVRDALRLLGVRAETITGDTDKGERARLIREFRNGQVTALTNANVLTTGFDAPGVDLIAMLRPTLSTGLYVQMLGRGTRVVWPAGFRPDDSDAAGRREAIASGPKSDCLVLDFAGNVRRHGPVDVVQVDAKRHQTGEKEPKVKAATDDVAAKECPGCKALLALRVLTCSYCGHQFPPPDPKHEATADTVPILSSQAPSQEEIPVLSWAAQRHTKIGAPDSVRVSYSAGVQTFPEWVAFEHSGPRGERAAAWWRKHAGQLPAPRTVTEALSRWSELTKPAAIVVKRNGKYWDVIGRRMGALA